MPDRVASQESRNGAITLRCFAKINSVLLVGERRADGFHDLDLEFQSVELHDDLRLEPDDRWSLTVEGAAAAEIPIDDNLVLRAARALAASVGLRRLPGARFHLRKRIPSAAGLGGGSADAAGALLGLDRLYGLGLDDDLLARIAIEIGSDVPYFLRGGRQRGQGRGERLSALPEAPPEPVLLIKPGFGLATADVFRTLAGLRASRPAPPPGDGVLTTRKTDTTFHSEPWWMATPPTPRNDLAEAALILAPDLRRIARVVEQVFPGARLGMSGSGPTLFAFLEDGSQAVERIQAALPDVAAWLTRTLPASAYREGRFVQSS